jgi:4-hydroxyproline epimerase
LQADVAVEVPGIGVLRGDIAWGGNWFFLVAEHGQDLVASNTTALMQFTMRVRSALAAQGITGTDGAPIDHIELFGAGSAPGIDSRNFVLCSGNAYDRSPCGTGTSAKVACLAADGLLAEGAIWRQESIVGSCFEASYSRRGEDVIPTIHGRAHLSADAQLLFDERDPFAWGIPK